MKQLGEFYPVDADKLTGYFLPWRTDCDQPQLIAIEGVNFLPVFSTEEKLHQAISILRVPYTVKRIEDGLEFLRSIGRQVDVCVDPWYTPQGTTRFTKVMPLDDSEGSN